MKKLSLLEVNDFLLRQISFLSRPDNLERIDEDFKIYRKNHYHNHINNVSIKKALITGRCIDETRIPLWNSIDLIWRKDYCEEINHQTVHTGENVVNIHSLWVDNILPQHAVLVSGIGYAEKREYLKSLDIVSYVVSGRSRYHSHASFKENFSRCYEIFSEYEGVPFHKKNLQYFLRYVEAALTVNTDYVFRKRIQKYSTLESIYENFKKGDPKREDFEDFFNKHSDYGIFATQVLRAIFGTVPEAFNWA